MIMKKFNENSSYIYIYNGNRINGTSCIFTVGRKKRNNNFFGTDKISNPTISKL